MKKKIITALLTVIVSIPYFLIMPKAASTLTSQYTSTNYGDYWVETGYSTTEYDYEVGPFGIKFPVNSGSWLEFHYNFKQEYNGYVTFTLKSNANTALNTCVFSVQGATFTQSPNLTNNTNTRSIQLRFNNSTGFVFRIMKQESFTLVSNSTFGTNSSITITSSNFNAEPDLSDVMYVLNNVDFYLPGMSQSLTNIASNTATMASDIAVLKGYLDDIEPLLGKLGLGLDSIWFAWNSVDAGPGTSISNQNDPNLYLFQSGLNNETVKRVDVRFTTNDIKDGNYLLLKYYFGLAGTNVNISNYYTFPNLRFQYRNPEGTLSSVNLFTDDDLNITKFIDWNPTRNTYILSVYVPAGVFFASNNANYTYDFNIYNFTLNNVTSIGFMFGGMVNSLPYDTQYLNLLDSINNGISAIGGDYDTSQYDQYEQTIDGLNDSMRDRFNNSETTFQNNINNILTPDQTSGGSNTIFEQFHFNTINGLFTGFLSDIFTAAPMLRYILLFGLLLLVLGVFI